MALTFSFFFPLFVFVCLNMRGKLGSLSSLPLMPLWQARYMWGIVRSGEALCLPFLRRRRRLERQWESSCAQPLTPWKLPRDLLWLSLVSGFCSTAQRASHLGRRTHGYSQGQGCHPAAMLEYPCLRGIHGGMVPGGGESWLLQV